MLCHQRARICTASGARSDSILLLSVFRDVSGQIRVNSLLLPIALNRIAFSSMSECGARGRRTPPAQRHCFALNVCFSNKEARGKPHEVPREKLSRLLYSQRTLITQYRIEDELHRTFSSPDVGSQPDLGRPWIEVCTNFCFPGELLRVRLAGLR